VWIFELKYCKTDAQESEIAAKQNEGLEQIQQYLASDRLKDRTDLKAAVIVFVGKSKYKILLVNK
jgi:acetaldehyde dehydrogenase (acetylating)